MEYRFLIYAVFICLPLKFSGFSSIENSNHINRFPSPGINLKDIKNIPDLYFECRIAQIGENSTISMFYNSAVREYIELYLMGRLNQIPELCILAEKYFPVFETQLANSGLPDELKYIPVIESALDPMALSPSGAFGLWQFKAETGRSYGLIINETSDERSDPEKSTLAACEYLKYLNSIFEDWQLSLLAYHAGPSTLKNAIIKAGGKTSLKDIYDFLPMATQRYLPAYFASIYVLNNYKNHI